jgi:hypothetical protein
MQKYSNLKQLKKIARKGAVLTSAERHRRVAERAEANHQFDFAAHEFFEASKKFRQDGKPHEAEEMRTQGRRVLSKVVMLLDSANDIESQAVKLTSYASELARGSEESDPSDLYRLAADLYEEAADRYLALVDQTQEEERRHEYKSKAALQLQRAGRNLTRAVNTSENPEAEREARDLYWQSSRLQGSQDVEDGEEPPVHSSENMGTSMTMEWLRRSGRMKCWECDHLWKTYKENSQRHVALIRMQESGNTGNATLSQHVAIAAEWWRISMKAVLDHETNHGVESGGSPEEAVPVGRAS